MLRWTNPKNNDLTLAAFGFLLIAAAAAAGAMAWRLDAFSHPDHAKSGVILCAAMTAVVWPMLPKMILKNRAERTLAFITACAMTALTIVMFVKPDLLSPYA